MAADSSPTNLPTAFLEVDHFGMIIDELHLLKDLRAHISQDGQHSHAYNALIGNRLKLLEYFPRVDDEQPFSLKDCFMMGEIWVLLLELGFRSTENLPSIDSLVRDVRHHLYSDELDEFDRLNVPDETCSLSRPSAVIFVNALRKSLPIDHMEPAVYFLLRSRPDNMYSRLPVVGGWDTSAT